MAGKKKGKSHKANYNKGAFNNGMSKRERKKQNRDELVL